MNTDVRGRSYAPKGQTPVAIAIDGTRQPEADQPFDNEEARLLYVVMTRATDKLVLTSNEASAQAGLAVMPV